MKTALKRVSSTIISSSRDATVQHFDHLGIKQEKKVYGFDQNKKFKIKMNPTNKKNCHKLKGLTMQ